MEYILQVLGCFTLIRICWKIISWRPKLSWRNPLTNKIIDKKVKKVVNEIREEFKVPKNHQLIRKLPLAMNIEDIQALTSKYKLYRESDFNQGKVSGTVYFGNENNHDNLMIECVRKFMYSNPLHPDQFPDIRIMETEVINMAIDMMNGDENCCGNITSGGTESIILACKTYRDMKGVENPEMIVSESVHAAFYKAGQLLGIRIIKMKEENGKTDYRSINKLISQNTIMLVGSAPNFAYGTMDNIEVLGLYAKKYQTPLHVDCCLGGFILPFLEMEEKFDFKVDGVTSISLDPHKYGYSMKGSSIILYKNEGIRKYQYFINSDWNGGIYGTPTISGSKSGVSIATTWCSMVYFGKNEYRRISNEIYELMKEIEFELKMMEEIMVIGKPVSTVIAFTGENIYVIGSKMQEYGWNLNVLQNPPALHLCLTYLHVKNKIKDKFLSDLRRAIKMSKLDKKETGTCAIYGMSKNIGDKSIVDEVVCGYLDSLTKNY